MTNLEKALALNNQKFLDSLPVEPPVYEYSDSYIKFRAKLFDKMRNNKYHRLTRKATAFVIIAAILLSISIVALAATVGKDFILKHFNGYAEVEVAEVEDSLMIDSFRLGYIPKGFVKTDEFKSNLEITYSFKCNDKWFDITKQDINADMTYDEEESTLQIETIDGQKYIFSPSKKSNALAWNNGQYLYDINGNLTKDELLKIAQQAE